MHNYIQYKNLQFEIYVLLIIINNYFELYANLYNFYNSYKDCWTATARIKWKKYNTYV